MSKVRKRDLVRISLRLALLQSTWCEGGMQSVGFAYCLVPGLQRLNLTPQGLAWTVKRHSEPFNTHPFLAGVVAGATLRLEEEGRDNQEIASFLRTTMGPLAALGDPFFRSALPTLAAVVASLAAMIYGALAGIITLILLFNIIHVFVRLGGVLIGYRDGYSVLPRVGRWLSPRSTVMIKTTAAIGAGVVLVVSMTRFGFAEPRWLAVVFGAGGVILALALKKWPLFQAYSLPVMLVIILCIEVLI